MSFANFLDNLLHESVAPMSTTDKSDLATAIEEILAGPEYAEQREEYAQEFRRRGLPVAQGERKRIRQARAGIRLRLPRKLAKHSP